MSLGTILLGALLAVVALHLAFRWRLLAFLVPRFESIRVQGVAVAFGCVAHGRSLWRVVRGATLPATAVWGVDRHRSDRTTPGHVPRCDHGWPCLSPLVLVFTVTFGVLANALLFLGASVSAGAVMSRIIITTTARTVTIVVAVIFVGVVERAVTVGIEEPVAHQWVLDDLEAGTVWNGASTGHRPGHTSRPARGLTRGRHLAGEFRNRL